MCRALKMYFFKYTRNLSNKVKSHLWFATLFRVRANTHTLNFINWCRQIFKSYSLLCAQANTLFCSGNNKSAATGGRGWRGGGCKQTRVLDSADEDVQRAVCVDRGPGGVGHKASVRGDPVYNGVRVAPGLTAQSHTLTLQSSQLLQQREETQLVGGIQHM